MFSLSHFCLIHEKAKVQKGEWLAKVTQQVCSQSPQGSQGHSRSLGLNHRCLLSLSPLPHSHPLFWAYPMNWESQLPLDMPCAHDPRVGVGFQLSVGLIDFLIISLPPDLSSPRHYVQRSLEATVALGPEFRAKTKGRGCWRPSVPFHSLLASTVAWPQAAVCSGHWRGGRQPGLVPEANAEHRPWVQGGGQLGARPPHGSCGGMRNTEPGSLSVISSRASWGPVLAVVSSSVYVTMGTPLLFSGLFSHLLWDCPGSRSL